MNYNIDTTMLPRYNYLRVCLSCWKNIPSDTRAPAKWIRSQGHMPMTVCSAMCGMRWTQILQKRSSSSSEKEKFKIEENPYFQKYKEKLGALKRTDPQQYEAKLKELLEKEIEIKEQMKKDLSTPPEPKVSNDTNKSDERKGSVSWPPRSLNEIMKLELLKDKTAEEIEMIWKEHYVSKDCVFGVVKDFDYDSLISRAKQFPLFVYPIPRHDGFEFILSQFSGKDVYFTPLGVFQQMKDNAPPCLTVAHFPELKDEKGIVLMAGQYDDKLLTKNESLNLVRQMSTYYGHGAGVNFNFVRLFNTVPEEFNYLNLIENYKTMKASLEDYYT